MHGGHGEHGGHGGNGGHGEDGEFGATRTRRGHQALRSLGALFVVLALCAPWPTAYAHDLESTRVLLTFARDGSFVLDVSNDPNWLKLRLERFSGSFADRVVLWVDGREVRPTSVEFIPAQRDEVAAGALATYRMRGRVPVDAGTLRWYYGLVADPYPLAVRRADGRVTLEEIGGDAWSGSIDLRGQFTAPWFSDRSALIAVFGLLLLPLVLRAAARLKASRYNRPFGPLGKQPHATTGQM